MRFTIAHTNINVSDMDRALAFYRDALGLEPLRVREAADGRFKIAFLTDGSSDHQLELTWLRDHPQRYDLGDNESHICFRAPDYQAAYEKHKAMGCICYENKEMGLYFIEDPDGYWLEIVPERR